MSTGGALNCWPVFGFFGHIVLAEGVDRDSSVCVACRQVDLKFGLIYNLNYLFWDAKSNRKNKSARGCGIMPAAFDDGVSD